MQREDVERLCAPIEKIVNYEYSSRDALIHNCNLGAIDMGQLQDLCAALRALLAERDAAFAAGQEEMRERSAVACRVSHQEQAEGCWGSEGMEMSRVLHDAIRALPIKDGPDGR